jgi:hypothetical protein
MVERIKKFLAENPKYVEILKRAVEHEEKHMNEPYYLGWEWHDVKAWPVELMKLVREGIINIKYKSSRHTSYVLADREAVKKCLELMNV